MITKTSVIGVLESIKEFIISIFVLKVYTFFKTYVV